MKKTPLLLKELRKKMEIATVMSKATHLILEVIGSSIFKENVSIGDHEEEIEMLANTIGFVGGVLSNLESMLFQAKDSSVVDALNRLRSAFRHAVDVLDEVKTHRKKNKLEASDEEMKETSSIISCSNSTELINAMKEIRSNLDAYSTMESTGIKTKHTALSVSAARIIGRDEDKRKITDLLLGASTDQPQIPVISVVGIGGMGKTTVAQLVYDDNKQFEGCEFDLKLWVSDSQKFDLKLLLHKILMSITPGDMSLHNLALDQLKNRITREINGKKYLLVLDGVENESREEWVKLEGFLKLGAQGSRILATTRSRKVAEAMGSGSMYELEGLSADDSWTLFKEIAFDGSKDDDLVELGRCIVEQCGRVPLAIKTLGRLLRGQDKRRWEQVRDNGVTSDVIHDLRTSYDALDAKLKECFRYCAMFPKSWPISKESLIAIWMSNVSIESESAEDVCEEMIEALCDRCFLEKYGRCFRMHDLMYDLAKEVAGEDVRHLILNPNIQTVPAFTRLHTLLHYEIYTWRNPWEKVFNVDKLVSDCPVLRMLDLRKFRIDNVPDSVGRLIHLRYLNLSYNEFQTLPDSITELLNLQSLLLESCKNLKELPVGIRKLINLRHLNLEGCSALTRMPSGMGALTSLRTLSVFIVGDSESEDTAKLEDLEQLPKLQGELIIKLPEKVTLGGGGGLLSSKARLRRLKIEWAECRDDTASDEDILAKLQPHGDLDNFTLYGYECLRFPPWGDDLASVLPNLVAVTVDSSRTCRRLPSFSKLAWLKRLTVCDLSSLEYMEETAPGAVFFPALKYFWLMGLPNLKGWCKEQPSWVPSFPRLTELHIYGCPTLKMTSFPVASLPVYTLKGDEVDVFTISARKAFSGRFYTNDARLYMSMPWEQCLHGGTMSLKIIDINVFDIPSPSMDEAFTRMCKVLTNLEMKSIPGLKTVPRALQHLTALQELKIVSCSEFTGEEHEGDGPLEGFESLRKSILDDLPALVRLPKEIEFSTSLQVLEIRHCTSLKGVSMGIRALINLRELSLEWCGDWDEAFVFTGLSRFQWLKCLSLLGLPGLEYVQESDSAALSFPSLECVSLCHLPGLKDWCRGLATGVEQEQCLQPFPPLSSIGIHGCPNFSDKSILFSSVTEFVYGGCFRSFGTSSPSMSSSGVCTNEAFILKSALWEQHLRGNPLSVAISDCDIEAAMMELDLGKVSSHLISLKLEGCQSLKTVPKGLKYLTALQKLSIERCQEFTCEEHEEDSSGSNGETRWGGFRNLTHFELAYLPKMTRIPDWIQFINSLQEVQICGCNNLLVPEWVHTKFDYVTLPEENGFRLVKKR